MLSSSWCNFLGSTTAVLRFAVVFIVCTLAAPLFLRAQEQVSTRGNDRVSKEFRIFYRYDDSRLDTTYLGNSATLRRLDKQINKADFEPGEMLEVTAVSSPEGSYSYNMRLSTNRAKTLANYLKDRFPEIKDRIVTRPVAEAWADFRKVIEFDPTLTKEQRQELLDVIDNEDDPDAKEKIFKGRPLYSFLYDTYFSHLRYATITLSWPIPVLDDDIEIAEIPIDEVPFEYETLPESDYQWVDMEQRPIYEKQRIEILAAKTNLLYDAVTALNFEVEVPIGNRWSIVWEDVFPWWETGNKYCFQMWEMGAEGRFWFKKWDPWGDNKLRGFFAGVYGMSSKYDFQFDHEINYQGEYWSAGVSGGWVMPLGKKKWFNLEFSAALGYLQTDYRHYMPTDEYDRLIRDKYKTGRVSYFGPTKAKISLVFPICFSRKVKVNE